MKQIILTAIAIGAFTIATQAQMDQFDKPTKEEKASMKAKQEQQLNDALKQIGLNDDQATQVKNALKDAAKKGSDLKKDTTLNDDQKAAKKTEIDTEKNDKLKQIMGTDGYRQWNALRKKNKEINMGPLGPD
jgi:hypothetical protein